MSNLNPDQFSFVKAEPKSMGGSKNHVLQALGADGSPLGGIEWRHSTGEVHNITVSPEARRQGLATSLWTRANEIAEETRGVKQPRHSPQRTNDGDAWARSLGSRLPRRQS